MTASLQRIKSCDVEPWLRKRQARCYHSTIFPRQNSSGGAYRTRHRHFAELHQINCLDYGVSMFMLFCLIISDLRTHFMFIPLLVGMTVWGQSVFLAASVCAGILGGCMDLVIVGWWWNWFRHDGFFGSFILVVAVCQRIRTVGWIWWWWALAAKRIRCGIWILAFSFGACIMLWRCSMDWHGPKV